MIHDAVINSIVWFRKDLRISDNPALYHAAKNGSVLPVFIIDTTASLEIGESSRWWLKKSLKSLNQSMDNNLNIYVGDPKKIIMELVTKYHINQVYWNTCYEPAQDAQDEIIKKHLETKNPILSTNLQYVVSYTHYYFKQNCYQTQCYTR